MEIIVSRSALLLTRVVRSHTNRGNIISEPFLDAPRLRLTLSNSSHYQTARSLAIFHTKNCQLQLANRYEYSHLSGSTLEDAGFAFDEVSPLAKTDLSRFIDKSAFNTERPLLLGIFNRSQRYQRTRSRTAMLSRSLPAESIFSLDPSLAISSPELTIMQLAEKLDLVDLSLVIMELCGRYTLLPERDGSLSRERGFASCAYPATSCARIAEFIKRADMRRHRNKLEIALACCSDNSASPMETALTLMLTLPPELGGFGLPVPILNPEITVPAELRSYVGRGGFSPDLYYPQWLCDLEYESSAFHFDPLQATLVGDQLDRWRKSEVVHQTADRRRWRDIQALGITVIPVVNNDFHSAHRINQVVWALERQAQGLSDTPLNFTGYVADANDGFSAMPSKSLTTHKRSQAPTAEHPTSKSHITTRATNRHAHSDGHIKQVDLDWTRTQLLRHLST